MREINSEKINPVIRTLLSYATAEDKVEAEYKKYLEMNSRKLYALEMKGSYVGCMGLEVIEPTIGVIKHIAVLPSERGKGVGRKMLNFIMKHHSFNLLCAETDNEAVAFYRNCGFTVKSLGEKYVGVERFLCEFRMK